ncbi:MAG TPA: nodulation protein NfeD [Anaeromyxobacteraceae bacterium]|nr:nodulation protein NfeD [Anaeromyxobacteraceae bacterium]
MPRARRLLIALALAALAVEGAAARGAGAPASGKAGAPPESAPRVLTVEVRGAITVGTSEHLAAALRRAAEQRLDAVAVVLDTPGGALEATREIVRAMLASPVPVLVWVGPAGARAGSAGVFVLLAADLAAMDPSTNVGAAHPVTGTGQDVAEAAGKEMARKVENDAAAFARTVAEAHGRNVAWAEQAVRESVAVTATEALRLRVIDLVAPSLREALDAADGRVATSPSGVRMLRTRDAVLEPFPKTIRQRALSIVADPNTAALLMLLGTLGIALELYHPGSIVPGVVGGLCLLLAFVAMQAVPVDVGAVLLVVTGVALLVVEGYVPAHGLAGLGGAACVVLGTLFFVDRTSPDYLFDPAAFSLSPWLVWPTPLALCAVLGFVAWKVARARRAPLQLGSTALVGSLGEALAGVDAGGGEVFVHGEYWRARSRSPIAAGARVRVVAVEGLTVTVETAAAGEER